MTVEQHAEAAANEIDRSMTDGPVTIIAKHMQAAIDEALASKMVVALDSASNHVHEVDLLRQRIVELEGLGPLIEEYVGERMKQAEAEAIDDWGDRKVFENRADRVKAKITAILTGGAK